MKRAWIDYHPRWTSGPMSFWVHRPVVDTVPWQDAPAYEPPAPPPVAGRGWPVYHVEFDDLHLVFASLAELRVCIEVLGRKVLPSTAELTRQRGMQGSANQLWLSRLPAGVHRAAYRAKLVPYLRRCETQFEREVTR